MTRVGYVMAVSRTGKVTVPAAVRARWQTAEVIVVDLGDHVVIRPVSPDPVGRLRGGYVGRGASADTSRRRADGAVGTRDQPT